VICQALKQALPILSRGAARFGGGPPDLSYFARGRGSRLGDGAAGIYPGFAAGFQASMASFVPRDPARFPPGGFREQRDEQ
jgi:hypothetical protein